MTTTQKFPSLGRLRDARRQRQAAHRRRADGAAAGAEALLGGARRFVVVPTFVVQDVAVPVSEIKNDKE